MAVFLLSSSSLSLPVSSCLKDEVNQIMETNLWLRHVSDVCVQHVLLHLVHLIFVSLTVRMNCDKKMCIA